jgi:hypothetical protein
VVRTWMNERETRGSGVLDRVKSEDLRQVEAAEILGLSYRQTKRLYRRFSKLVGRGWYMDMWVSDPTMPRRRDFAGGCWPWYASITAGSRANAWDRR